MSKLKKPVLRKEHTMTKFMNSFVRDENGAVTVDWVVLTAAVVGLAIAAYGSISDGSAELTENIETQLGAFTVGAVALTEEE
jgi:Flp pilus assembly pilin Flp